MPATRSDLPEADSGVPSTRFRGEISWPYSRRELFADGAVHAVGLILVIAGSVMLSFAMRVAPTADRAAVSAYLASLVASFAASAAYNLWPVSRAKWVLRRLDQSAIYLLIAGTYTPLLAAMNSWRALVAVWIVALFGVLLRLARPDRYDRLAIGLYLLLGWSGIVMVDEALSSLPSQVLWLVAAGGLTYTAGVIFHVWSSLRFQNAVWHAFVLAAASTHFVAIWLVGTSAT
ncbi:hemolysin III family protein [Hansschlegelia quercus]|uniref:Hemolysin III family protein n=1 Tax=Hansschlegelia quercus TaxID=2528245 RepID=A0A4Q9GPP0_9HYPH|nr:hemolysin III family protein [Hansschlegelia quercus]TBN55195.1 hemolysin III family protein [Hansschlegelia quercus]